MDRTEQVSASDLLNEEQAAALLLISQRTLQDWRWKGIGPDFMRMGRLIRYRRSTLLAWFEANAGQSEKPVSRMPPPPVLRAVEVPGEEGRAGRLAAWCPWCERAHRHGAADGGGHRVAHCATPARSPLSCTGYDLDVIGDGDGEEAVTPGAMMIGEQRLGDALAAAAPDLRRLTLRIVMGLTRVGRDLAQKRLPKGVAWVFGLHGWRIERADGSAVDGAGLMRLASELYGIPAGVVAVRLLEAASAETFDAEAAFAIQQAVDDWTARGAPKRGARA